MKAEITARAFDPHTGQLFHSWDQPRIEIIDPETNNLFKCCETLTDITEKYMQFWNRLPTNQTELVLIQSIRWLP